MTTMQRTHLSPQEVGDMLGLSAQTIRNYCKSGRFPGAQKPSKGSVWLIPIEAVRAFTAPPEPDAEPVLARSPRSQGRGRG